MSLIDLSWGSSLSVSPRERSFEADFLGALRKIDLSGELSEAFNANFLQVLTLVQTQMPQDPSRGSNFVPQQNAAWNVSESGAVTNQNGGDYSNSVSLYPLLTAQRANFANEFGSENATQGKREQASESRSASSETSPQFNRELEHSHSVENGQPANGAGDSNFMPQDNSVAGNLEFPPNPDNRNFENHNVEQNSSLERSDDRSVVREEQLESRFEHSDTPTDIRETLERTAVADLAKTVRSEHQRALLQYRSTIESVASTASPHERPQVSSKSPDDHDVSEIAGTESATDLAEQLASFDLQFSQSSLDDDRERDGDDSTQFDGMTSDVVDGMQTAHNAGPVETPQRPPRVQHGTLERVAELTARQASFVEEGGRQSFQIKLDPLGLGELMIDIQRDLDGKFEIRISAASQETHSLLQQQLDQMTQSLGQMGIPLSQFDVMHSGSGSGNGHGQFESENQEQERLFETNTARPVRMTDSQRSENTGINFRA